MPPQDAGAPDFQLPVVRRTRSVKGVSLRSDVRERLRREYLRLDRDLESALMNGHVLGPKLLSTEAWGSLFREFKTTAEAALSGTTHALEFLPSISREFAAAAAAQYGSTQAFVRTVDLVRGANSRAAALIFGDHPVDALLAADSDENVDRTIARLRAEYGGHLPQTKGAHAVLKVHPSRLHKEVMKRIGAQNLDNTPGPKGPRRRTS